MRSVHDGSRGHSTRHRWFALVAALLTAVTVLAQPPDKYPSKPMHWILAYAPGGITDRLARDYAAQLQVSLGQSVVVENRAGGNSLPGTLAALAAPADGYTLFTIAPPLLTGPSLYPGGRWPDDPLAAFTPVSMFIKVTNALVVPAHSPYRTIQELIADAKAKGKPVLFGTGGVGAAHHLAALQFGVLTGIEMSSVGYKGSGPLITDLLGGHIGLVSDTLSNWVAHAKSGKVRVLLVLGPTRSKLLPDVPSMADLGHPTFEGAGWQGLGVRAGTPRAVVDRLAAEVQRITRSPEFKRYEENGDELVGGTPEQFAEHIRSEGNRSKNIIERFGLKPD